MDLSVNYRDLLIQFLPTSIFSEVCIVNGDREEAVTHTEHRAYPERVRLSFHYIICFVCPF